MRQQRSCEWYLFAIKPNHHQTLFVMKFHQDPSAAVSSAMDRIHHQYSELAELTSGLSLLNLFNSNEFQFDAFCRDFHPHPNIGELKSKTIDFGREYGILLPNAEHYVTCAMFLFPSAPMEKIIRLSKNYAVDFYLNDTMGREAKPTTEEKQRLYEIRDRLAAVGDDLETYGAISTAEKANLEVLAEISRTSPVNWFRHFLKQYLQHIDVAHKSYDAASLGYVPSIEEYIDIRCSISGMPHTVTLIEYATNNYLDWDKLLSAGLKDDIEQLNLTVALVGALTNDLFSFEKEVIDHKTDSNLVMVILLNNFRMKLIEAIQLSGNIIRDLLADYAHLSMAITQKATHSDDLSPNDLDRLDTYLKGLKAVLQACWTWQTATRRYKRSDSIWLETTVSELVATS
jgi:hypothetical protein